VTQPTQIARGALCCLALGVCTTLGISWALAALKPVPKYPRTRVHAFVAWGRPWNVAQASTVGVESNWWMDLHADGVGDAEALVRGTLSEPRAPSQHERSGEPITWGMFAGEPPAAANVLGHDIAFGWPRPCLWYQVTGVLTPTPRGSTLSDGVPAGGILLSGTASARGENFRALPYRVLWPRLLANIAFWTLFWAALYVVPRLVRGARRRRLGLCLHCGYDRRDLPADTPCPECGREGIGHR